MDKYEYCQEIIEQSSATFYKAFGMLEEKRRNAVFSIYAFCRKADDAIDVHNDIKIVEDLEDKIQKTFDGDVPDEPLFQALYETIMRFPSDVRPYLDLLNGMKDDYNDKPIKTEKDFDEYCYKAAGSVGLMLLPVLASESYKKNSKKLKEVAIELGKAMQITNILRDVRDDLQDRRVYFPDEIIEQFQVNIKTLRTGTVTPEYKSLVENYIDIAKEKYNVFYDNLKLFDKDAILPTYTAARFYEGILDEIRKDGYTNITKRHYVGKLRKYFMLKKIRRELKKRGLSK